MALLIVNAGSSSLKLRLLDPDDQTDVDYWDGDPRALDEFASRPGITAVVHRVVHGGDHFDGPVLVDDKVEQRIEALVQLAPLHQPRSLELIRHSRQLLPRASVVACFDTSFHRTLPPAAATYALPGDWRRRWGLRRFGFHGLSHAYVAGRCSELLGRDDLRLVSCHLGSGASVCAIDRGRSVDTSMGFTPVEGLVMATRSGSVDPGLLTWLLTDGGLTAAEVADGIEHRAGLLGLSEMSGDMREVLAGRDRGDERCALAFDVYVHRLAGEIARMRASLDRLDAIAFTGGVGEHSAQVRDAVCDRLGFQVAVLVVPSREDLEMARQARALL